MPPAENTPFRAWGPPFLLEEVLGEVGRPTTAYVALADLYETDEALILEMTAPGLTLEDLEVSLYGNKLTVRDQAKPVDVDGEAGAESRHRGRPFLAERAWSG